MTSDEKLLSNREIRPTAVRLLVLRFLMNQRNAISLTQLEDQLLYSDKSTLYRTLKTFEKQKIVHVIDDGTGMTKYALCLENCQCDVQDQHFHFHCDNCQETYCLTDQNVPQINLPPNFKVSQANLVLKGLCANCN